MKYFLSLFLAAVSVAAESNVAQRAANTVILDPQAVANLGLAFAPVEEADFEQSLFAVGRIEEIPSRRAVVTSRIPGRLVGVEAYVGDRVEAGQEIARIESRQAGNPPPVVPLRAPAAGLVVASRLVLGAAVEPSETLVKILDLAEMWAVARVPEPYVSRLVPGRTEARIVVPAAGDEAIVGKFVRFGTAADTQSGTIDAIFAVSNPGDRLRPGMRAEFSIVVGKRSGVLAVPRAAVQGDPGHQVVYVKDFELANAFLRTSVTLGEQNDQMVEVKSGVFPGDEVVTTGAYLLGFAGRGNVSLKEALDAAHGHAHNEDGSEITASLRDQAAAAPPSHNGLVVFLSLTCFVLVALLGLSLLRQRTSRPTRDA